MDESQAEATTEQRPAEPADSRRATNEAVENLQRWNTTQNVGREPAAISLEAAQRVVVEAKRVDEAVVFAQLVLEGAIKTVIGSQLPKTMDPLISQFVNSLLSSSVKTFTSSAVANTISTFADALSWGLTRLRVNGGFRTLELAYRLHRRIPSEGGDRGPSERETTR